MKKTTFIVVGMVAALSLAGCTEREKGSIMGGVIGAVGGSLVGKGNGQLVAIGIGTLFGSVLGSSIGDRLDKQQRTQVEDQVTHALDYNNDGQAQRWEDPNAAVSARTVPVHSYQTANGGYCREFQQEIRIAGEVEVGYGKACRQPDGSWKIIS